MFEQTFQKYMQKIDAHFEDIIQMMPRKMWRSEYTIQERENSRFVLQCVYNINDSIDDVCSECIFDFDDVCQLIGLSISSHDHRKIRLLKTGFVEKYHNDNTNGDLFDDPCDCLSIRGFIHLCYYLANHPAVIAERPFMLHFLLTCEHVFSNIK